MNLTPNSKKCLRAILRVVLVVALGIVSLGSFAQTTIFTETMGTVGSTTTIATHETADGFDNDSYTMSSGGATNPADIRVTNPSSGYSGASGLANVWFTTTSGEYGFGIEGISTIGYTNLVLSFGVYKNNASGTAFASLALEYSTDGSTWNTISVSSYPTSSDDIGWYFIPNISIPIDANEQPNLRLRWRKTGTIGCRIDDIVVVGSSVSCSVSITSFSPTSGPPGTVVTISGSGFTGTTSVDFGTGNVAVTEENDGLIYATVPAAATTGVISVTTTCTSSSSGTFTVIPNGVCAGSADDLFFSEYIEGSGNNKALEIYNGTGSSVDLTDYEVRLYSNGSATVSNSESLSGTLADGDVLVIANTSSNATIQSVADILVNTVTSFNGDDAIALYNNSTSSYVDIFGRIGEDPGSAWTSASNTTVNKTLVRNDDVDAGVTTNPASGFPTLETEWTQYNEDTFSDLGSHTFSGGGGSDLSIDTDPSAQTECEGDDATFTVSASASGAIDYQWYWYNDGTSSWDAVSGETSASLTVSSVTTAMDGYQYYCEVTDGSCTLTSNAAMLSVDICCTAPTDEPTALTFTNITAISMDVDWTAPASGCDGYVVKIGTDATFTNLIDGTSLPSGDNAPWADEDIVLTGTASTGFTISSLNQNTTYYYKVYPYKLCGSTYKFNNTGLTGSVTTLTQSDPAATCADGSLVITLPISNESNATYQWQVYNGSTWSDVTNTSPYSGATTKELTISPLPQTVNGYMYLCQISSSVHLCETPSASFTVTVNSLPATPIIESVTQNCGSTDLTMSTPPAGVTWYWQTVVDGIDEGNSALTLNVIADGTYYLRAKSDNGCWSTNSAAETVTVKEVPTATLALTGACGSGTAEITSTITGEQTFELLDDVGDPLVPPRSVTVTGNSYTFNGIVDGDYTAMVTYNGCSSALTAVETMANTPISGEPTVSDVSICGTGTATLSATLGTNSDRIEWSLDGSSVDETDMTPGPYEYDVIFGTEDQTVTVYVRSSNGTCPSAWEQVNAISNITPKTTGIIAL